MARIEPTAKEEALALAEALEYGVVTATEIVAWADQTILAQATPDSAICDLALMARASRDDLVARLRDVGGAADLGVAQGLLIEHWIHAVNGPADPGKVARWLFRDATYSSQWGSNAEQARGFSQAIDLADDGIQGSYEVEVAAMVLFLFQVAHGWLACESLGMIAQTFDIGGRGLILVTDQPTSATTPVGVGAKIRIRRADGQVVLTSVAGLHGAPEPSSERPVAFLVRALAPADAPIGAEVWMMTLDPGA